MSVHPSASSDVHGHTPSPSAAALPSAAAAAAAAVSPSPSIAAPHPTTVMQADAGVCASPSDSAVDVLPGIVTPTAAAASVIPLQSAATAVPPSSSASSDSAKSQKCTSLGSSQPQGEAQGSSGSRDNREKHGSTPSHARIDSPQRALLIASDAEDECKHRQEHISSPSHAVREGSASSGVGAGSGAAVSTARVDSSPIVSTLAALAATFHSRKTHTHSAGQREVMDLSGDDDVTSSSSAAAAWTQGAETSYCLTVDEGRLSNQSDRAKLHNLIANSLSVADRKKALLEWMPALEQCGLGWVSVRESRLHIYFQDHDSLAKALKAVQSLVRCVIFARVPKPWEAPSSDCHTCYKTIKHSLPEALRFTVIAQQAPPEGSARLAAFQSVLKEMQLDVQTAWPSSRQEGMKITFWVLPREVNILALAAIVAGCMDSTRSSAALSACRDRTRRSSDDAESVRSWATKKGIVPFSAVWQFAWCSRVP